VAKGWDLGRGKGDCPSILLGNAREQSRENTKRRVYEKKKKSEL